MRIYTASIDSLDRDIQICQEEMGKSVTLEVKEKTITYVRYGKGTKPIQSPFHRTVHIIKAVALTIITLGILTCLSREIRANLQGRCLVNLYLQDPLTSKSQNVAAAIQSLNNAFRDYSSIRYMPNELRVQLYGSWPHLQSQNLQTLTANQAALLLADDLRYISGFTEEQKKALLPKFNFTFWRTNQHELFHFLRNIDVNLLSDDHKRFLRNSSLKLPVDCDIAQIKRIAHLLDIDSFSENQLKAFIPTVTLDKLSQLEIESFFGKPSAPNKKSIALLDNNQMMLLIKKDPLYQNGLTQEQVKHVFNLVFAKLPDSDILPYVMWTIFTKEQLGLIRNFFEKDGISALSGVSLEKYFKIFACNSTEILQKFSFRQLLESLPFFSVDTFRSLSHDQQNELLVQPQVHKLPRHLLPLTNSQKNRFYKSLDIKALEVCHLKELFFNADKTFAIINFARLSGQQMLDLADKKGVILADSLLFHMHSDSLNTILDSLLSVQISANQFNVLFAPTALSLTYYLRKEDLVVLWNVVTPKHLAVIAKRVVDSFIDSFEDQLFETAENRNKLFGYFLEVKDFERAINIMVLGIDLNAHLKALGPLLFHAVTYGFLPLVETLIAAGADLAVRDKENNTLLHIAAYYSKFEIFEMLCKKINVMALNSDAVLASEYIEESSYFLALDKLEQAFLLDDTNECEKILTYMNADDARSEIDYLRKRYPASCVDHILYSLNKKHFEHTSQVAIPPDIAPNCNINEMLTFFDQINFNDADGPDYVDPKNFYTDTKTLDPAVLRENLADYLRKVQMREAYLGTPPAGSESLEVFYHTIERAITHTLKLIHEMPESGEKQRIIRRTVVDYIRAAKYCGGKLYANAYQQYVAVRSGNSPTFEDDILDALGNYREVLFQTLVPNNGNVHSFNYMMKHLGKELGIPGADMTFDDPFGGHGVNLNTIRKNFDKLYCTRNIIFECVKQQVEQSGDLRGKLIDWFKINLPEEWNMAHFKTIHDGLAECKTDAEKKAYLTENDIYQLPNRSFEQAIEDERAMQYLAKEVVVDMDSPKMQIKPTAITYMLHRMQIIKPVYDWVYHQAVFDAGKALISKTFRNALHLLGKLF